MATHSVVLPEELSARLANLALRTGRSEDSFLVEALEEHLSDIEALELAEDRLTTHRAERSRSFTQAEIEARYGVED